MTEIIYANDQLVKKKKKKEMKKGGNTGRKAMASVTEDLGINRRSRRYRPVDIRWGQSGGTDDSKQD